MLIDCNRIMIDERRLCIVKDSCLGCKIDTKTCAINDLLEDAGILKNWETFPLPNFRERRTDEQNI